MKGGRIEGIILAAGKGTRMLPLTGVLPKPLLPVTGIPLLEITAEKLLRCGASRLHINLFHLGGRIRDFAAGRDWPVTFHEEEELLDTGGGIGNMASDLRDADHILLHNGDILSSFGFGDALEFHRDRGALVTMILMRPDGSGRTPPASVRVGAGNDVLGIGPSSRAVSPPRGPVLMGYTGTAVISGDALEYFPRGKKGLVPVLLEMIARMPGSVAAFDISLARPSGSRPEHSSETHASSAGTSSGDGPAWGEIGSPQSYLDIHRRIMVEKVRFEGTVPPPLPLRAGALSSIDHGASWKGFLDVGDGARIEGNTFLEDCVVLAGATVGSGTRLSRAIIYEGGVMEVEN
jgi:NDP-sugar pyrophosphorylase family protein